MTPPGKITDAPICRLLLGADAIRLGPDDIWYATGQESVSYPAEGNDFCFQVEDQSFWFRHRNACIVEMVKRFPPRPLGFIADVGGGNGFVAKGLMDAGWDVVLIEPGPSGAHNAKRRGLQHVVCATTQAARFSVSSMPAIGAFDVIEHIDDDAALLSHLRDLSEQNGMLYLTVPACPWAWSNDDVYAGHFRRYTRSMLTHALRLAGWEVQFISAIFSWLLLPVFFLRALPCRMSVAKTSQPGAEKMRADHSLPSLVASAANAVHQWELKRISQCKPIALGSSLICAARKK